jgi:hypothetical protein
MVKESRPRRASTRLAPHDDMALRFFELPEYPDQIAVCDVGALVGNGTFFLDFSRPLEPRRRWFGSIVGMLVPVIHQGEHSGGYVIGVRSGDPTFKELRMFWKERYPTERTPPSQEADALQIITDFARQFPNNC